MSQEDSPASQVGTLVSQVDSLEYKVGAVVLGKLCSCVGFR